VSRLPRITSVAAGGSGVLLQRDQDAGTGQARRRIPRAAFEHVEQPAEVGRGDDEAVRSDAREDALGAQEVPRMVGDRGIEAGRHFLAAMQARALGMRIKDQGKAPPSDRVIDRGADPLGPDHLGDPVRAALHL